MTKTTTATTLVNFESPETERVHHLDLCQEVHLRLLPADREQVELIRSTYGGLSMSAAIRAAIHQTAKKIKSGG